VRLVSLGTFFTVKATRFRKYGQIGPILGFVLKSLRATYKKNVSYKEARGVKLTNEFTFYQLVN
jgi:hypothetical protein